MIKSNKLSRTTLAAALFSFAATSAHAQVPTAQPLVEPATKTNAKALSVDVSVGAVTDYRFRGVSLSNRQPAIQPSITVTHDSGLYGSVWASNIADNGGDSVEVDLVAGYTGQTGTLAYSLSATYYLYPRASPTNYAEFIGTIGTNIGPARFGLTVGYAPPQRNIGDQDNLYVAVNGCVPIKGTPLSLTGSFGIENGAFATAKRDWSLGVNADVAGFTIGAAYVDTARAGLGSLGKPAAVVSISRVF